MTIGEQTIVRNIIEHARPRPIFGFYQENQKIQPYGGFDCGVISSRDQQKIIEKAKIDSSKKRNTGIPDNRTDVHLCSLLYDSSVIVITNNFREFHWKKAKEKFPDRLILWDDIENLLRKHDNSLVKALEILYKPNS